MLPYFWLFMVFVLGCAVGSFVNVCVARLPLEKSILWPGSRCGRCFQRIRWYDNLPLVSYLILRGRCRACGQRFSARYFLVELATGLGFAGLFYLEVMLNVHQWAPPVHPSALEFGLYPAEWWLGWGFHAVLFAFLMTASVCDLGGREIPFQIPATGMAVGLVGAVVFAWPWPYRPKEALEPINQQVARGAPVQAWWALPPGVGPKEALYPWPVWGPLPAWLEPGGNWQTGLATGLAGMLAGTLLLRAVAFLFGTGLGKEALGMGDADLMMMAGAFLGWQPVAVAFLVSALPGLLVGVVQLAVRRDNSLPFGPSLAAGVLITMLCWRWIGPHVQILFFWPEVLISLAVVGGGFMFLSSFLFRLLRGREEPVS